MTKPHTPDRMSERELRMSVATLLANEFASLRLEENIDLLANLPAKWALRMADKAIREVKATRS